MIIINIIIVAESFSSKDDVEGADDARRLRKAKFRDDDDLTAVWNIPNIYITYNIFYIINKC